MPLDLKNNRQAKEGRKWANIRALKLAAEHAGLKISEYLDSVKMTREQFLAGDRPPGYADRKKKR